MKEDKVWYQKESPEENGLNGMSFSKLELFLSQMCFGAWLLLHQNIST